MRVILIVLLTLISLFGVGQSKIDRKYFIELLNSGQYNEVFIKAMEIRKKPYGKNAVVDYFIAKSLCMKGFKEEARVWLSYIQKQYPLNSDQRSFMQKEELLCTKPFTESGGPMSNFSYINYAPLPESEVHGKGGFTLDCYSNIRNREDKIKTTLELEERIFDTSSRYNAYNKIKSLIDSSYTIDTSGRFIILSDKDQINALNDLNNITQKLEDAYIFFLKTYKLKPSDKLFTVYLAPNKIRLQKAAELLHGIILPHNSIGYSSLSDLFLLGITNSNSVGTLYHELFHLTIRTEVGDIPAWLDEGIACMYAVYKSINNELYGALRTWRVSHFKVLTIFSESNVTVPTLEQLIEMNWEEFEGGIDGNACKSSIHYSMSNMFLLFLQHKKLVYPMVNAFKNRIESINHSMTPDITNIQIVEKVFADNIKNITKEFYEWMKTNYNINMAELVKGLPYQSRQRFPIHLQEIRDSISVLIIQIKDSKILRKREVKSIYSKYFNIDDQYFNLKDELKEMETGQLQNIANEIPDEEIVGNDIISNRYQDELDAIETAYKNMQFELISILKAKRKNK